ncbi:MAG: dihydroorotate dehydrogenase electron transfer subunit [Eubacterium sp.]|nr:dihydroorotate dehydrogenase electron transfer subunit [Eubacterium sp.]
MKKTETAKVISQEELTSGIFSLWLENENTAADAKAGQFVNVYCAEKSRLLPRPISICEIDKEKGRIRLVYRIKGEGTKEFSRLQPGDTVKILGPNGNGFPLEEAEGKLLYLVSGGIGIPPMLECAKEADSAGTVSVMGYRNADTFLAADFDRYAKCVISTDDGSLGYHGNAVQALEAAADTMMPEIIFACGPKVLLAAVKKFAEEAGIPCWVSMEERMACGIGACLACVCESVETDEHTHVKNKRVCKEGPVFAAGEIVL